MTQKIASIAFEAARKHLAIRKGRQSCPRCCKISLEELTAVRQKLIEPRFTGFDDQTLIFPLQLNNRIASLQDYLEGDHGPTAQDTAVFEQLLSDLTQALASLEQILETDLPLF